MQLYVFYLFCLQWALYFYRKEASLFPDVVVAQIDPKKLKKKQSVNVSVSVTSKQPTSMVVCCKSYVCNNFISQITGCLAAPQGFSPSLKWQQQEVSKFSEIRQVFNFNCIGYFYLYLSSICLSSIVNCFLVFRVLTSIVSIGKLSFWMIMLSW